MSKDNETGSMVATVVLAVIFAVVLVSAGGYVTYTHFRQRGIRNNNPGNLRLTDIAWKGKVPRSQNTDGAFEQFRDDAGVPGHIWGIRAAYVDVRSKLSGGYNTVRKIISRYAPPNENNTEAYIAVVARAVGKSADAALTSADLPRVLEAIIKHENGVQPYPATDLQRAIALA